MNSNSSLPEVVQQVMGDIFATPVNFYESFSLVANTYQKLNQESRYYQLVIEAYVRQQLIAYDDTTIQLDLTLMQKLDGQKIFWHQDLHSYFIHDGTLEMRLGNRRQSQEIDYVFGVRYLEKDYTIILEVETGGRNFNRFKKNLKPQNRQTKLHFLSPGLQRLNRENIYFAFVVFRDHLHKLKNDNQHLMFDDISVFPLPFSQQQYKNMLKEGIDQISS